jgi:hypothetical protein
MNFDEDTINTMKREEAAETFTSTSLIDNGNIY